MDNLSGFLGRFNKLLKEKEQKEEVVCSVVREVCGVDVSPKKITIKKHALSIQTDAPTKSVLFIKKEVLIKKINKALGKKVITEIR
jgi:hypothetical protein